MSKVTHHVVPNPDGGWNVEKRGAEKASVYFEKKQDAIDKAREISKNQGTELKIHDKHEKIRDSDSHGHDPYPLRR